MTSKVIRKTLNGVKSAVAFAMAFSVGAALAADTRGYVQTGLIAHWDGVENVGRNTHSSDTDKWIDLVAGREFTLTSVTVNADRLTFAGAATSYGLLSEADAAETFDKAGTGGTVEIVLKADGTGNAVAVQSSTVALGRYNGQTIASSVNQNVINWCWDAVATNMITVTYDKSSVVQEFVVNGEAKAKHTSQNYFGANGKSVTIGVRQSKANPHFSGSIYAIRIYNRELSAEERAQNAALDELRFIKGESGADVNVINVDGTPETVGTVTPAYGVNPNHVVGQSYTYSAPSCATNSSWQYVYQCVGWELKQQDGTVTSNTAETVRNCTFTYADELDGATLTWLWGNRTPCGDGTNYVDAVTGNDETARPGSTVFKYKTIQKAIDLSQANGVVLLADGTYELTSTLMLANGIHLIGGGYEKCVIRAKSGSAIRIMIMEGAETLLEGMTVCGGVRAWNQNWTDACGAGIWLKGGTVSHCMISNNQMQASNVFGGGIYACAGTVTHCVFTKNIAGGDNSGYGASGGGFGCGVGGFNGMSITGPILIDRCLFIGNQATAQGGGIYNAGSGSGALTIRHCTVADNKVLYSGGSAGLSGSTGNMSAVESCIFTDNLKTTKTEPQSANCSITSATIFKKCLFGNGETAQGAGSISGDAKFVSLENGDYHLQAGSDAIDTGLVSELVTPDLEDYLIMDGKPDIGCYEYMVHGITVSGEPGEWGHPVPDYGTSEDVTEGETYSFTAPAAVTNDEGTAYGTCRGWRLMDAKGKVREGTETAAAFTYEMENGPYFLTWLWDSTYLVTATAVGGGTVDFAEAWMKEGSELTVTASETDTAKLWSWFGGVDKATRREFTQTLTVDRPLALVAKFYDPEGTEKLVAYVSPTGAGNKDGYDAGNANDSIADALVLVSVENAAGGEVRFVSGTYNISETLPLRQNLSYVGATDGESVLDGAKLSAGPCFVGAAADDVAGGCLDGLVVSNCSKGCVTIAASTGDFRVTGCRFTSGNFGIDAKSTSESRILVSNCTFAALKVTGNTYNCAAGVTTRGCMRPTLADCLITGNSMDGNNGVERSTAFTYVPTAAGAPAVLRNCRIIDNTTVGYCNGAIVHESSVDSGLRIYGCTFLRNSVRITQNTNMQRATCIGVRAPGGGVRVYDSYFGYNTMTYENTSQSPKVATVLACYDTSGNFAFVNCTIEHNVLRSVTSTDGIGTVSVGWAKQIGFAHCVFNENDVIHVDATTAEETRCGELQVGNGSYATGLFNSIFTHSATDYVYCASNSDPSRQHWVTVNCNIKNYVTPANKQWKAYWENITTNDQPKLDKLRDSGSGLLARGVAHDSPFRKGGGVWRVASTGMPYLYSKNGFGTVSANPWMPLVPCDTAIADVAAAELGLTTETPPMDDAFGAARREKRIAYGPLNAPPRGLMLLVR